MNFKRLLYLCLFFVLALVSIVLASLWLSLPKLDGEVALAGLRYQVQVDSDSLGIPTIQATNRDDAMRVLGWVHARDRMFQMELIRRKSAGRLAELFGPAAVEWDKQQRTLGFERAAREILAGMPQEQQQAHQAYAEGFNAFLSQAKMLPPEFLLLRHSPEPWRVEDSLLVGLGMFQTLTSQEQEERMLTVMKTVLPDAVMQFLTPDAGEYDTVLLGGPQSRRPARPIPVEAWASLGQSTRADNGVDPVSVIAGSNQWVVGGKMTRDGRAIVANDMHLGLNVPNVWYRASLQYGNTALNGVTLPGLPLLVVGSNGHLAWGFTNVDADTYDLVRLELNPANANEYRTGQDWQAFERQTELIHVKDGEDQTVETKRTIWGPVSTKPLLGGPVAVHWTALQASGVDLGLLNMDSAETVEQGIAVMNQARGPTQNVALADDQGHIAWTLLGRYPLRRGFDGSFSVSWADAGVGWDGYIPPEALPHLIDPPSGFIATANNRTLGKDYPYIIAHNQSNAYRAYRITQRLKTQQGMDELALFSVQLDARSEFYDYYRQLALEMIGKPIGQNPELDEASRYLQAWDGQMNADSLGIGLLWLWRENLASIAFAPVVARCRQADPSFSYTWREMETPLRALLTERVPATLPDPKYTDWRDLLLQTLAESVKELKQRQNAASLDGLTWGKINRLAIRHPFSQSMPFLSPWLDMAETDFSGCATFCVRVTGNGHGASERMVVSPGHPEQGILHMPAGQSGNPFSPHYRDQQAAWQQGTPLPFLPGESMHTLIFRPD